MLQAFSDPWIWRDRKEGRVATYLYKAGESYLLHRVLITLVSNFQRVSKSDQKAGLEYKLNKEVMSEPGCGGTSL